MPVEPGPCGQNRDACRASSWVVRNPAVRGRIQSFYDPERPSWLLRFDPFVVHYCYDEEADEVIFLNLFRRQLVLIEFAFPDAHAPTIDFLIVLPGTSPRREAA